jgi:pyrimidine operon attenuation protein/uracil phosphoribosyltransferase
MPDSKKYILDQSTAEKKLKRLSLEIMENNPGISEVILAGISGSGLVIASHIKDYLSEWKDVQVKLITITLDKKNPGDVTLSENMDFNNKVIIVADDVSSSGRTLLYAMKPFLAYRPASIQALILVERMHNDFPVHPDYVGLAIATTLQERITVETDNGNVTGAYLN